MQLLLLRIAHWLSNFCFMWTFKGPPLYLHLPRAAECSVPAGVTLSNSKKYHSPGGPASSPGRTVLPPLRSPHCDKGVHSLHSTWLSLLLTWGNEGQKSQSNLLKTVKTHELQSHNLNPIFSDFRTLCLYFPSSCGLVNLPKQIRLEKWTGKRSIMLSPLPGKTSWKMPLRGIDSPAS